MSSYYVRPRANDRWTVHEEIWRDGKKSQPRILEQSYPSLGINPHWSLDEVKKRITLLNKEKKIERIKATEIARRVARLKEYDDIFFPEDLTEEFLDRLQASTAGTEDYWIRILGNFKFAQKMVLKLQLFPHQYEDRAPFIYRYFIEQKISVEYAQEILKSLNAWGKFISKKRATYFEPVPNIPKTFKRNIARAQKNKDGVARPAEPLTLDLLKKLKSKLKIEEYNWMFVALWFGLRPSELDRESGQPSIITHRVKKIKLLEVNQVKIESDEELESYKYIPVLYLEQKEALELLKSGKLKRPNYKKLQEITGEYITTYSPRKGFADLMIDLGQKESDASLWLGHKNIQTTRKHYKDPQNISFTEIVSK